MNANFLKMKNCLFSVNWRLPGVALAKAGVSRAIFFPSLRFVVSAFFILHSSFLLAQTPYYHLNRSFSSVQFDLQGIPTEVQLNEESDKLTDIVPGAIKLDTAGTYAIEKQTAIDVCYDDPEAAWDAVVAYNGTPVNYPGKTFDNVGWVRGMQNTDAGWGAYLWVLQNRIAFQSSTSAWWRASNSNGVPVAITNVMVGSLGDYLPMSNVVDIGPHLDAATNNNPGINLKGEEKEYQVDISNVFYELSIPDIWITPRDTVVAVGSSTTIQYTVTGTNIPNGVTWALIPDGLTSGAVIQVSNDWHFAGVTPRDVGTNYKVRATSVDNTNFYDQVDLTVVKIDILETNAYVGVSNTVTLHLTPDSTPDAQWEINPVLPNGANIQGASSGTSVVINAGGVSTNYIVKAYATALTNCFDTCTVTVIKADLIPDFNHDRVIDEVDRSQITTNGPFRFWINDDADTGDIADGDSDLPGRSGVSANCNNDHVDGRSDLEDFFPVWLDLHATLNIFPPSETVQYKLRQASGALRFVYTDLTKDQAGNFLTTESAVYGAAFNKNAYEADTVAITGDGVALSETFLNKIVNDENKGVLMIEGAGVTTAPLVLEIWSNDHKIFEQELPISINGVEKMYRWVNLRPVAGGSMTRATDIGQPQNYPDTLCNGKQFIFVHGYSVHEEGARAWNSEMFKRLYQSGSRAMFTAVTWYGNEGQISDWIPFVGGSTLDYYANVVNAFETSSGLVAAINGLPGQKYIAAHSLGNMVVSSAIKDYGLNVSAYFMLNAAVAREAYDPDALNINDMRHPDWQNYSNRLWAAEWYQLFDSADGRHALTWRDRFQGISGVYNYYSSTEDVLANADGSVPAIGRVQAWACQEMRKGTTFMWLAPGNAEAGWGFSGAYDGLTTEQANALPDENIRTNSFFDYFFDTALYGTNGNTVAQQPETRRQLLSDAIPALSNPMGRNPLEGFGNANKDYMNYRRGTYPSGWPRSDNDWRHSDIKNVAYPYNSKIFNEIIKDGGL